MQDVPLHSRWKVAPQFSCVEQRFAPPPKTASHEFCTQARCVSCGTDEELLVLLELIDDEISDEESADDTREEETSDCRLLDSTDDPTALEREEAMEDDEGIGQQRSVEVEESEEDDAEFVDEAFEIADEENASRDDDTSEDAIDDGADEERSEKDDDTKDDSADDDVNEDAEHVPGTTEQ